MITVDINPEFGIELALALPYAYWLHENNQLEKVVVSKGMRPFYYFCDNVEEKYDFRTIDNSKAGLNTLPNSWIYGNKDNAKLYKNTTHITLTRHARLKHCIKTDKTFLLLTSPP